MSFLSSFCIESVDFQSAAMRITELRFVTFRHTGQCSLILTKRTKANPEEEAEEEGKNACGGCKEGEAKVVAVEAPVWAHGHALSSDYVPKKDL